MPSFRQSLRPQYFWPLIGRHPPDAAAHAEFVFAPQSPPAAAPAESQAQTTREATADPKVGRTLLVEPDAGFSQIYALVTNAQKTIDMTMYELVDTTFSADLVAACKRGVTGARHSRPEFREDRNTPAYNQLKRRPNAAPSGPTRYITPRTRRA